MSGAINAFSAGIIYICQIVMHFIGIVDDELGAAMNAVGIFDAHWQLYVVLVLCVVLVVLSMRAVGGLFGWLVLLLSVLILLHRILPDGQAQVSTPGFSQLRNTL